MLNRRRTNPVTVGQITIGGDAPIVVQTMCDTPTEDVEASVAQIGRIKAAGCNLVRLTVQGERQVEAMRQIRLRCADVALVADVHFRADIAIAVAPYVDKVRINPGNFLAATTQGTSPLIHSDFQKLLGICKEHNTAIRIGVNHGSLARRIVELWGDTPRGMVEAAMEFLRECQRAEFQNVIVSMKSSNVVVMVEAYRLLAQQMEVNRLYYPLHLGVTEAGNGQSGRIKSAVGIGALLREGLGDTIRVSLTEPPENEIPVAERLANYSETGNLKSDITDNGTLCLKYPELSAEEIALRAAVDSSMPLINKQATDLKIEAEGICRSILDDITADILQAARVRITKTEYIACPGCGRTLYDLQSTLSDVKRRTSHLVGLKIAVMGCIVNGPGEMADADYGYVGAGVGRISIYRGKELINSNIPQEEAIDELLKLIEK